MSVSFRIDTDIKKWYRHPIGFDPIRILLPWDWTRKSKSTSRRKYTHGLGETGSNSADCLDSAIFRNSDELSDIDSATRVILTFRSLLTENLKLSSLQFIFQIHCRSWNFIFQNVCIPSQIIFPLTRVYAELLEKKRDYNTIFSKYPGLFYTLPWKCFDFGKNHSASNSSNLWNSRFSGEHTNFIGKSIISTVLYVLVTVEASEAVAARKRVLGGVGRPYGTVFKNIYNLQFEQN